MTLGNKESYEDWLSHLRDMVSRGLKTPLTVTGGGAPGLISAVEAGWPEAERIRCFLHKMRNVLDKVPEDVRPLLKPWLEAVRDAADYESGKQLALSVIEKFSPSYPSAMKSLSEDLQASLAHLKLPSAPKERPHHQSRGAQLLGGAQADQGHPTLPGRERMSEAGLFGALAGVRAVAEGALYGYRAQALR